LEALVYTSKRQLDEIKEGSGVEEGKIDEAKEALQNTMTWLDSNLASATLDEIQEKKAEVEKVLHPLAELLYKNNGSGSSSGHGNADEDDSSRTHQGDEL